MDSTGGKMFAQAASRSLTSWFEIRRAVSASGNVLKASRIFSAMRWLLDCREIPGLRFAPLGMTEGAPANPAAAEDEIDIVTPLRRPTGQAFALADGEKLDPVVLADEISIDIVNRAAMKFAFAKMRAQERFVIAPGHKTDFLAVNFVGNFQA